MVDREWRSGILEQWSSGIGLALTGALVVAVGTVLPWAQLQTAEGVETLVGIDDNGFLTLLLSIAVVGIIGIREWHRLERATTALLGAMIVALAMEFLLGPLFRGAAATQLAEGGITASPRIGVYVALLGGLIVLAGGLHGLLAARR